MTPELTCFIMQMRRQPARQVFDPVFSFTLPARQWSALATAELLGGFTVHDSVSAFERRRRTALEEKRRKRKNRTVTAPTPDPSLYLQPLWPNQDGRSTIMYLLSLRCSNKPPSCICRADESRQEGDDSFSESPSDVLADFVVRQADGVGGANSKYVTKSY
ncbi:hypothetical protein Bbelb_204800 [Branchiostoma belcheri]|nr:hypothetical protein Bbelb_204800 [Branchiostoma belcheri]